MRKKYIPPLLEARSTDLTGVFMTLSVGKTREGNVHDPDEEEDAEEALIMMREMEEAEKRGMSLW